MAIQKIMVPTDGSEFTKDAIDTAIEIAKMTGASITALYVVDAGSMAVRGDMYESVTTLLNKEGEEAVKYVKDHCDEAGVPCETKIEGGRAAETIVDESSDYDLIVMSTLGKTGMTKFLIGSVAEKVVAAAHCKVLTIRAK